jgi:polar amino acid transport system permease protein
MELDFTPILESWGYLLGGLGVTIALSGSTIAVSLILGGMLGAARVYGPALLRIPVVFYIDTMRSIPVLVVLVWTYFAVPIITPWSLPPFWAALVALSAHIAAYVAEIVRAGLVSVRPGQIEAAYALGLHRVQAVALVVLPQALMRMLPAFGSVLSITIKDTAIAAVIAVPEFMKRSETLAGQSFHPIEVFSLAMLVYFLLLFPITEATEALYRHLAPRGRS